MKDFPAALTARLAEGATTLCQCWRITRTDGTVLGFTDHDRALVFDDVVHRAATGLTATSSESALGLSVGDVSVVGILSDDSLSEADLAKGLYDGAVVTVYWVDWQDPSVRVVVRTARIGEVSRSETSFVAELRSLAGDLSQTQGRRYTYGCDADVGDARCGVDLAGAAFMGAGAVSAAPTGARLFRASGLAAFATGHFSRGRIVWTSGANEGLAGEIKRHDVAAGIVTLELWAAPPAVPALGDTFSVTAGCDKQVSTCRLKFSNMARYRGFPYMPGNDWVLSYPSESDAMDGGSRYHD